MLDLNFERLQSVTNADPEFKLTARLLNARLRIFADREAHIITIKDGAIHSVNRNPTLFDEWDIDVGGPAEDWRKILQRIPPPLYQDLFPAAAHKGFRMAGNLELLFSYYPAFRRLIDIMREVANAPAAAA